MPGPVAHSHSYEYTSLVNVTRLTDSYPPHSIYQAYIAFRKQKPTPLPPALAAVSALLTALHDLSPQTVSETLSLLHSLAEDLKLHVRNPTILASGTDVFRQYLVTTLARTGHAGPDTEPLRNVVAAEQRKTDDLASADDFQATKAAIIKAGERYVRRALDNRIRAAQYGGRRWLRTGWTIFVPAPSQAVADLLTEAVDAGEFFRVVLVESNKSGTGGSDQRYTELEQVLKKSETPVVRIPPEKLAAALAHSPRFDVEDHSHADDRSVVLTGAAAVLANGGIMGTEGTLQAACVAKAMGKEFWAVAQSAGCARWTAKDQKPALSFETLDEEPKRSELWEDGDMDITVCLVAINWPIPD